MFQIASALNELGFGFYYPVRPFFQDISFNELASRIEREYCERISKYFNRDLLKKSFDTVRIKGLFEVRTQRPSLEELMKFIEQGRAVICMISYDKLTDQTLGILKQNGHYITLTGMGKNFVYAHDSGPQGAMPNRPIRKNKFIGCWDFNFFDWDLIVV
ncbi:hypothetical protein J4218_04200 [Candidatus Pacearchaeota archaeon]|nr:hypothetical protein [Candidatus Pacearchaeota archaeon]